MEIGWCFFQVEIEHHLPLAVLKTNPCLDHIPKIQPKFSIFLICEGSANYILLNFLAEEELKPTIIMFHKVAFIA